MKIIIAGSRGITKISTLNKTVDRLLWINPKFFDHLSAIISGTANGVDKLGEQWAQFNSIPVIKMPADWNTHGKAAGPIRNAAMAEIADFAIILWDGSSPGTLNMLQNMQKLNKPYFLDIQT